MPNTHPAGPWPVNPVLLSPAPRFRRQVLKAAGYILLFFFTYTLLLLIATALATAFIAGGIMLAITIHKALAIITALVMVLLGIMLLLFLTSFLFSSQKEERPLRTLLQPSEHPRLFDLISVISAATRTRFPRRIFAIPGVQAAIFYNSAAGSLLRPANNNLEIGLGLVNSLNISELQMVLARALGRFSRRGMQPGGYVSILHQWIYHQLYENGSWHHTISEWAGFSRVLRPFSQVAIGIGNSILYVLRRQFGMINRVYLPLSREMEFYADAIGMQITGSQAAISAQHRLEMGSFCLEQGLHKLPLLAVEQLRFHNLYEIHAALLHRYAQQNHLALDAARLPLITDAYLQSSIKSRVQFRSRGASQPSPEEREQRYKAAAIDHAVNTTSAWELFNDPLRMQENMTALIYHREVPDDGGYHWYPVQEFIMELDQQYRQYEFSGVFNGYYDNRSFTRLTPACQQPLSTADQSRYTYPALYAPAHTLQIKQLFRNRQDVETLQAITSRQIPVSHFEFDGQTYPAHHAPQLLIALQVEIAQQETWLLGHDCLAFRVHYARALNKGAGKARILLQLYESVLQHQEKALLLSDQVAKIIHCTGILFSTMDLTMEEALPFFDVLDEESRHFKKLLQELWQHPAIFSACEPDLEQKTAHFLRHPYSYLDGHTPRTQEIWLLHEISTAVLDHYNNYVTSIKKQYLEYVLELEAVSPQTGVPGR